jgi:hypothetical protein
METGVRYLTSTDLDTYTTAATDQLGAVGATEDGRIFRYVKFGGTSTINPGLVLQGPAAPANSTGLVITAAGTGGQVTSNLQAGSNTLVLTNGGTAVTADQFQTVEIVTNGTLPLYSLRVAGHTAAAATTGYITLKLKDRLPQNITQLVPGTDTANLSLSRFNGPTASLTGNAPVGVTRNVIPNTSSVTNFGWVQSGGQCYVKATTATIGLGVACDLAGTPGYVIISAATTGNIGWAKTSSSSGQASVVLNIG